MRWFKHMTAAPQDERIAAYMGECGFSHAHEGYGFYWLLMEIIATQMDKDSDKCSATYPLTTWSRLLYCHHNMVQKYFRKLEAVGLIVLKLPQGYSEVTPHATGGGKVGGKVGGNREVTSKYLSGSIEVLVPKLLKYRDEYSKKSGVFSDSVRSKKQIQSIDTETETETETLSAAVAAQGPPTTLFPVESPTGPTVKWIAAQHDSWYYESYWNRKDRDGSRRAFEKRVRALMKESPLDAVGAVDFLRNQAVMDQQKFRETDDWEWRQNMHPATWLNGKRWEDQPKARDSPRGAVRQSNAERMLAEAEELMRDAN